MQSNTLLENYRRKLKEVTEMKKTLRFKDNSNPEYIRLSAKASCYKSFVADLERELAKDHTNT
jgi:hypothetical protein